MTQAFDDREPVAASQGLTPVRPVGFADVGSTDMQPADIKALDPRIRIMGKSDRSNPNASCHPARGVVVSGPTATDRTIPI